MTEWHANILEALSHPFSWQRGSKLTCLITVIVASVSSIAFAADDFDFRREVGPLLAKRCTACHDPVQKKGGLDLTRRESALKGGESGPAVVPGKLTESPLWQRVSDGEMPPKHPLSESERRLLQAWIERGAPWSGDPLDPLEFTSEQRAGYDWWSLQPLREVIPPPASPRVRNPIDAFIEQRLTAAKLAPSSEANARSLVRRLYFGLVGLPPAPEEVAAFIQAYSPSPARPAANSLLVQENNNQAGQSKPDAYERLVDKLLASPSYGERWARHWLDVARFGESQGFERDRLRLNAWRYRDWVIDAFNRDLPYDEFVRLQLAGDVLHPGDADALIATGFLVAGPWDEVGQTQQSAAMKAVVRQDELEDLVGTVGQAFLGLTVNCARCHDHKFDPIRQAEYYRLAATLAGVHHGEPNLPAAMLDQRDRELKLPLKARLNEIESRLSNIERPQRLRVLSERQAAELQHPLPRPIAAWDFKTDARDTIGDLHWELKEGAELKDGALHLDGHGFAITPLLKQPLTEKTFEAWVKLHDLEQRGGSLIGIETRYGTIFDTIVYAQREPRQWNVENQSERGVRAIDGPDENSSDRFVQVAVTYQEDGTIALYRDGKPYGKPHREGTPTTFPADTSHLLLGLRPSRAKTERGLRCAIQRARIYDRALKPEEVLRSANADADSITDADLTAGMTDADRNERADLRFERDQLRQALTRIDQAKVYAVAPAKPEVTHVLRRGNPGDPAEEVTAGGIAAVRGTLADFKLPADAPDADRRRQLAEWITDRRNPLFARVMVNRLWHYHFGVGLVDTPNDFGFNGGRPSHPELLDWLAGELIRSNWSLKHIQRLIVTSATYRQSSRLIPAAAEVDAGNRLLWRKSPQRLEAETLRDTLLQLSGDLELSQHGPGFYEFTTFTRNSQFYVMRDAVGPTFRRRTIYRTWVRSARSQLLDVFDCPDPSTKTPQRAVTTTPLQALSLLNNSFVLRAADAFAQRVQHEVGADRQQQVRQVFRYALGRPPDEVERSACESLVAQHGLPALCHVIFNGNELLFVD